MNNKELTKLKGVEEIKDKCLKLTDGIINDDFWGLVFGSLIDYGHEHGGLMSHKAFMEAIEISKLLTTSSHEEIKREAVEEFVSDIESEPDIDKYCKTVVRSIFNLTQKETQ